MIKIMGRKSYGSIPHLSISKLTQQADKKIDLASEGYLTKNRRNKFGEIIVTEKVDGSNVGIYKENNKLYALTRSGWLCKESKYKHHILFDDFVNTYKDKYLFLLDNGERLCGEWMIKKISLSYKIPHEPFISFDIFNQNNERIIYDDFKERCSNNKIITTGLVHRGEPISIQDAMNKLGSGFHGCLEVPEGIVYRYEENGKVLFLAKYVRDSKVDGLYLEQDLWNEWDFSKFNFNNNEE